jgi:hypothetical protein
MFSDASEVAYSASAYVRITDDQGGIHCSFVMGKCRNSPIKRPTIPRLELLASVMAVRLSNLIRSKFDWKFDNIIFWTDSTTVLQYGQILPPCCSRRFHRFVATRLQEIHELTKPGQWRFVPGKLNPADDGSRGLPIEVFKAKCRWLSGPDFLHQSVDQCPCTTITKVLEDCEGGLTKQAFQNVVAVVAAKMCCMVDSIRNVYPIQAKYPFMCQPNHLSRDEEFSTSDRKIGAAGILS